MIRLKKSKMVAALALVTATGTLAGVGSAGASSSGHDPATQVTYEVTYKNLTSGQYLTPPNFAAHNRDVDVFSRGHKASPGVQAVAENGGVPVLAAELEQLLEGRVGTSGVGADGPIAPGEQVSFQFTTDATRLSVVSMVICTNDGFAGLDSTRLPTRDGRTRTRSIRAYDAGTEINTEMRADLVPAPFCGEGEGATESNPELAENGVIRRHRTLRGVGDLDPGLDWKGPVAEISITRVPAPATYTVTIKNATHGQYLTPPNFAAHARSVDVYQRGQKASPAIQGLAENGDVAGLAAALSTAVDEAGLGVSGVGADAPIGPGESITFNFTTTERRFSLASMVICTNDGFAGLDSVRLPNASGKTRNFWVRALDAGTEINTEMRADLVPAPFCGEGEGATESNPELAENGVIRRHRTLRGIGDLDPSLDWSGQVMDISITRN